MSLSFDEFRAVSKRNKKEDSDHDEEVDENISLSRTEKSSDDDSSKEQRKAPFTLGDFLEMQEIQSLTLFFLLLDTFASYAELSVVNNTTDDSKLHVYALVVKVVHSLSSFFVFFFAFEIISLLIAFRLRIFGHLGYVTDMIVIGLQIWAVTTGILTVECHILNIFRMWRLIRLFQSMVSASIDGHSEAKIALKNIVMKKKTLQDEVEKLTLDLKKEQDARSSVEAMLQDYKDEIDTLNEALKIAALDIAEVAQAEDDFFLSDDEGMDEHVHDEDMSTDVSQSASLMSEEDHRIGGRGASSNVSFASNDTATNSTAGPAMQKKEELYKEALKESKATPKSQRSTFIINENGSCQQS